MDIKPIRTDADYQAALKEIDSLMMADRDTPNGEKLDVMVTLVEAHEAKHFPMELPDPVDAIKFEMEQFFRRMVFNVVARNQDDHTKNISFLMNRKGQWSLSPAYDITYCNGAGWTSKHQMTLNGKTDNFDRTDLLAVAEHADIKQSKADKIISNVINTVKRWPEFAKKAGVPKTKPVLDPKTKKPFVPEHDPDVPTWAESIQRFHRLKL